MNVSVVFPYRGTTEDRKRAFRYVYDHMESMLPGAEIVVADDGSPTFSRAGSRNKGVREAANDIVVVCDADSIPQERPILEAIESAYDNRLHLPYTHFLSLTREHSAKVLKDGARPRASKPQFVSTNSVGGVLVMTKEAYFAVGGQDEGFEGWGGEDVAFAFACEALLGPHVRHSGHLYGLWHESDMDQQSKQYKTNIERQNLYKRYRKDPEGMRQLLVNLNVA